MSLRVGIFGGGVVGGGVYEIVQKFMKSGKFPSLGANITISKICVRSLDKPRDFACNAGTKLVNDVNLIVTDYNEILNDPDIDCIVELMGGITNAKDVVYKAIHNNKHVITANKALIANFLPEIKSLLSSKPNVKFCFEAAVCGGIPIIHTLQSDFLGDSISKIMGIMNGTTNFMLCKMEDEGANYDDVLKQAQALGYAEADPTADVEGFDVQAKIAILAKLSFGKTVEVDKIPAKGISKVTAVDFEYAKIMRSTIKLIGAASMNANGSLAVYVSPTIIPHSSPFSGAKGPGNMCVVKSENMNMTTFAGPGAGRFPTANSVVNDLLRLAKGETCSPFPLDAESIAINNDYEGRFYVRINCSDGLGIVRSVGEAAELSAVSINSILQNPIVDPNNLNFVVTTEATKLSQITDFAARIAAMPFAISPPLFMPILD